MSEQLHSVFVYGTLKTGFGNWNSLLKDKSTFVSEAETKEKMFMVDNGSFPYVSDELQHTTIKGEVFVVDDRTLKTLDRLEGYNPTSNFNHYDRKIKTVILKDGRELEAYIYLASNFETCTNYPEVKDGIFVRKPYRTVSFR